MSGSALGGERFPRYGSASFFEIVLAPLQVRDVTQNRPGVGIWTFRQHGGTNDAEDGDAR